VPSTAKQGQNCRAFAFLLAINYNKKR